MSALISRATSTMQRQMWNIAEHNTKAYSLHYIVCHSLWTLYCWINRCIWCYMSNHVRGCLYCHYFFIMRPNINNKGQNIFRPPTSPKTKPLLCPWVCSIFFEAHPLSHKHHTEMPWNSNIELCLKPCISALRVHIASTHPSWSASPNQSLEVRARIKCPDAHSVCSIFGVHIVACLDYKNSQNFETTVKTRNVLCNDGWQQRDRRLKSL